MPAYSPADRGITKGAHGYDVEARVPEARDGDGYRRGHGRRASSHNEGFEVSFVQGRRTYDLLLELLDPKLVKFEFQMSTLNFGLVGAEYFTKYPGRFVAMHLQDIDMKAPAAPDQAGQLVHPQAPVGKGSIDWIKTFTAAKRCGVRHMFIEQTMEFTQQSAAFLKTLKV